MILENVQVEFLSFRHVFTHFEAEVGIPGWHTQTLRQGMSTLHTAQARCTNFAMMKLARDTTSSLSRPLALASAMIRMAC